MLQQSKESKIAYTKTKLSALSPSFFHAAFLGIFFCLAVITITPAFADNHYFITIENNQNCTDSCLSEEGLIIEEKSTVTRKNNDETFHVILSGISDTGRTGYFQSQTILPGEEFSFTFDIEGYYDYYCQTHPWMKGMIMVV